MCDSSQREAAARVMSDCTTALNALQIFLVELWKNHFRLSQLFVTGWQGVPTIEYFSLGIVLL